MANTPTEFADAIFGDGGPNVIDALGGDDLVSGAGGDDTLTGGDGNDVLFAGAGIDTLNGGAGRDGVSYFGYAGGVTVLLYDHLGYRTALSALFDGDTLNGIENITGSGHDDALWGDDKANTIHGNAGADQIIGLAGKDKLFGDAGEDDVLGGAGDDALSGGGDGDYLSGDADNDQLNGGDGDDYLNGGTGGDTLNGGGGIDKAAYWTSSAGIDVNLGAGTAVGGDAEGDTLSGIEDILGTYDFGDTLTGNGKDNELAGFGGKDTLNGKGGNDQLGGGAGNDHLNGGNGGDMLTGSDGADFLAGGAGADQFVYAQLTNSTAAARDTIADFETGIDKVNIAMDMDTVMAGFQFDHQVIGAAAFTAGDPGQIRFYASGSNMIAEVEVTGDAIADIVIKLANIGALADSDFI